MYKSKNKMSFKKGVKRYVARRSRPSRLGLYLDNDTVKVHCECYDQISINSGATAPIFGTSSNTYVNVLNMLQSSASFQENVLSYARYKIVGMAVRISPGAALATLDAAFTSCAPTLSVAFYPSLSGSGQGTNPAYNDHKLFLDPAITVPQTKYYRFPDGFLDNGASGFGVWSSTTSTVQIGQLSVTLNIPVAATVAAALFNVRTTFYLLFSNKNK